MVGRVPENKKNENQEADLDDVVLVLLDLLEHLLHLLVPLLLVGLHLLVQGGLCRCLRRLQYPVRNISCLESLLFLLFF
jgi:hypothetical protein